MTLDEAIKHCLEVAEEQEKEAEYHRECHKNYYEKDCRECAAEHRQLAEWMTELKEAKRLLRLAVDDFDILGEVKFSPKPGAHPKRREYIRILDLLDHRWRYADEALALIGEDTNVPEPPKDGEQNENN